MSLDYIQNIVDEINTSTTGGLLIISKGVGLQKVLAEYFDSFTEQKALILFFLINFSDEEIQEIEVLRSDKNKKNIPITKITYSTVSAKRCK